MNLLLQKIYYHTILTVTICLIKKKLKIKYDNKTKNFTIDINLNGKFVPT